MFDEDKDEVFSEYAVPCYICGDLGYSVYRDVYICDKCH